MGVEVHVLRCACCAITSSHLPRTGDISSVPQRNQYKHVALACGGGVLRGKLTATAVAGVQRVGMRWESTRPEFAPLDRQCLLRPALAFAPHVVADLMFF